MTRLLGIFASDSKSKGSFYEQQALLLLQQHGLQLIERNFHSRFGEIDLIMIDQQTLVFIEVRFRKNARHGSAAESITISKQRKLLAAANFFLSKHSQYHHHTCRFDALVIELDSNDQAQYDWLKNAFTE